MKKSQNMLVWLSIIAKFAVAGEMYRNIVHMQKRVQEI
jgi:hypothetical protein